MPSEPVASNKNYGLISIILYLVRALWIAYGIADVKEKDGPRNRFE